MPINTPNIQTVDQSFIDDTDERSIKARELLASVQRRREQEQPVEQSVEQVDRDDVRAIQGERRGVVGTAVKFGQAAAAGVESGIANTANALLDGYDAYARTVNRLPAFIQSRVTGQDFEKAYENWTPKSLPRFSPDATFGRPSEGEQGLTGAGLAITEGLSQFLTPYSAISKALKAKGVTGIAPTYAAGAMADFLAFSEENLANVVQTIPALQNRVTEFLAADEDDGEAIKRLKGAITGTLTAGVADVVLRTGARGVRKLKGASLGDSFKKMTPAEKEALVDSFAQATRAVKTVQKMRSEGVPEDKIAESIGFTTVPRVQVDKSASLADNFNRVVDEELRSVNAGNILRGEVQQSRTVARGKEAAKGKTDKQIKETIARAFNKDISDVDLAQVQQSIIKHVDVDESVRPYLLRAAQGEKLTLSNEEIEQIARTISPEDAEGLKRILKKPGGLAAISRSMTQDVVNSVDGMGDISVRAAAGDRDATIELMGRMAQASEALDANRTVGREVARALQMRQAPIDEAAVRAGNPEAVKRAQARAFDKIMKEVNPQEMQTVASMMAVLSENPEAMIKFLGTAKRTGMQTMFDFAHELFVNNLLSGPATHATNIFSTLGFMALQPIERLAAAGVSSVRRTTSSDDIERLVRAGKLQKQDAVVAQEFPELLRGYLEGANEAIRVAVGLRQADERLANLLQKGTRLDYDMAENSTIKMVADNLAQKMRSSGEAAAARQLDETGGIAKSYRYLGNAMAGATEIAGGTLRLPLTFMQASDRFQKTMAFRGQQRALARRHVNNEGLTGEAAERRFSELLDSAEVQDAVIKKFQDNMFQSADFYARQVTFQQDAPQIIKKITALREEIPTMRYFVPFIKTPTNIAIEGFVNRTPVGLASKKLRETIQMGGADADIAIARLGVGSMVGGLAASLVFSGNMSGSGPQDKAQRDALMQTGWRPYSIKGTDGKWYRYDRFEPLGAIMGGYSNILEARRYDDPLGDFDDDAYEGEIFEVMASSVQYMSDKTFMVGLKNLLDVASGDARSIREMVTGTAVNLSPMSAAQRTFVQSQDPNVKSIDRDDFAEEIAQRLFAQTPGLSEKVPNRTNIFGNNITRDDRLTAYILPISQGGVQSPEDEAIFGEIVDTFARIREPSRNFRGVRLSAEEHYERMKVLESFRDPNSGLTVKEAFWQVINDPIYKQLPNIEDGGRADVLRKIYTSYVQAANEVYLSQNEELQNRLLQLKLQKLTIDRDTLRR